MVIALTVGAVLAPAQAVADGLSDYPWVRRPLLVFAPTDSDPRLGETMGMAVLSGLGRRDS